MGLVRPWGHSLWSPVSGSWCQVLFLLAVLSPGWKLDPVELPRLLKEGFRLFGGGGVVVLAAPRGVVYRPVS